MLVPRIQRHHIKYICYGHVYDTCNGRDEKNCKVSYGLRGAVCRYDPDEKDHKKKCKADYSRLATNQLHPEYGTRQLVSDVVYNQNGEVISYKNNNGGIQRGRYR